MFFPQTTIAVAVRAAAAATTRRHDPHVDTDRPFERCRFAAKRNEPPNVIDEGRLTTKRAGGSENALRPEETRLGKKFSRPPDESPATFQQRPWSACERRAIARASAPCRSKCGTRIPVSRVDHDAARNLIERQNDGL